MNANHPTLTDWLSRACSLTNYAMIPLPGDASFRRYFRVQHQSRSYIVMDASVVRESCAPFVAISQGLRAKGLKTPEIIASDLSLGFLLLTDFGDKQYLKALNQDNVRELYGYALDALAVLQNCRHIDGWEIAPFTAEFMHQELNLCREWFLEKHLGLVLSAETTEMLNKTFEFLALSGQAQPQVFMHRDYHSANLMVLSENAVGILDFQDAFIGPVTYDAVSLLRDCYISWPDELVVELLETYWQKLSLPNVSFAEFRRWFDLMGVQRHLKALLTFSRKFRRDGNNGYLQHIPRTLQYVLAITEKYSECAELHNFLNTTVKKQCVE